MRRGRSLVDWWGGGGGRRDGRRGRRGKKAEDEGGGRGEVKERCLPLKKLKWPPRILRGQVFILCLLTVPIEGLSRLSM